MPIELFGFSLGKKGKTSPQATQSQSGGDKAQSFVSPDFDDGAIEIAGGEGGFYGTYLDVEGAIKNDIQLINKYRDMSLHPECEIAVDDIVNESIVYDETKKPVEINLDLLELSDSIKYKIETEFDNCLRLLDFGNRGYELFRRWYIDGKLYHHIILHDQSKKGILELRPIDATKIRKIRQVQKKLQQHGIAKVDLVDKVEEFYMYTDTDKNPSSTEGIKVALDAVSYIHSGLYDRTGKRVIGYLQKAIKPLNQLRMIEDAVVIYRISRAPERRIFYIDVGNLPKNKAEQYLKDIMNRYRNKLVYDASTGEIRDDKRHMSMLEDYWLPRREGGRGTEIATLDGGQNLGEMEDVEYFKKKLYKSLNVPSTRLEADNGFNMGRSAEITRDEVKFSKFVYRLKRKFSELFLSLLRVQLVLKGVITEEDWQSIVQDINFDFKKDSFYAELKEAEILKERMDVLNSMDEYIGKYYSVEYIRKNVLKQSDIDREEIDKQIKLEKDSGEIEGEDDEFS
jgi:hypothetical protein